MIHRTAPKEVLVLGGGFGGLEFCLKLPGAGCRVTLVDRQNHHLFQPLLYQVATCGLAAPNIAQPIRSILRRQKHVTVVMDNITGIDVEARTVACESMTLGYDYLVIALGGRTSYFGHEEWERYAPGLKSMADAFRIRTQVLYNYERAERETDPAVIKRLMTSVVVGGGPTGVEMAGALAELAKVCLRRDFRRIDPTRARVVLIESGDTILDSFGHHLGGRARQQLESLGVEVRTGTRVEDIERDRVELNDGTSIEAGCIVWGAGVSASPLTQGLGVETTRGGQLLVSPDLSLPGHPEVFAVGDLVAVKDKHGHPVPGVAPAAMQMAQHTAKIVGEEIATGTTPGAGARSAFSYFDKGSMATIGRSRAVAMVGKLQFSGFPAWIAWLVVHLLFLVDFRNKLVVFIQWTFSYFTYQRGARVFSREGKEILEDYVSGGGTG